MRKFLLATLVVLVSGACAHKAKTEAGPATPPAAAPTKDQAPPVEKKKSKKSKASHTATGTPDSVKCTHNSDERMLEIKDKDGGCETIYTKMGEAKAIATAAHGHEHCQEVSAKIQKNLTGAGFTCQ